MTPRVRQGSLGVLVLLLLEYGFGMYVNLYVQVPGADHGGDIGRAISNGPALLSLHAVLGLLLGLAAIGVLVQAIAARHVTAIVPAAIGLIAVALAAMAGADFTSTGHAAESMAMSVMTGVALLCYSAILLLLPAGVRPGRPAGWRRR